jgi:hypothetical protein
MASSLEQHPQHQQIIQLIAEGRSLRYIASHVNPPVGLMVLQRYAKFVVKPQLAARISIDKLWVQSQLIDVVFQAKKNKDLPTARAALVNIADLNGYNAPKRSESLAMNLHALAPAQLAAALRQAVTSLPAAARAELTAAEPDLVEIAGEIMPPADAVNQTPVSE